MNPGLSIEEALTSMYEARDQFDKVWKTSARDSTKYNYALASLNAARLIYREAKHNKK